MNPWLLEIIRCPITEQPLRAADVELVDRLRQLQQAGRLHSHKGIALENSFEAGLVNQAATYFYPICDGIPSLLPDEAIDLAAGPFEDSLPATKTAGQ